MPTPKLNETITIKMTARRGGRTVSWDFDGSPRAASKFWKHARGRVEFPDDGTPAVAGEFWRQGQLVDSFQGAAQ